MGQDGFQLIRSNDEDARRALEAQVARHPGYPDLQLTLGMAQYLAGDYEQARERCEIACELNPRFTLAHAALGYVNLRAGNAAGARAVFEHARGLDPDSSWAWNDLGMWWRMQGDPQEALKAFAAAFDRAPQNPVPLRNAGLACVAASDWAMAARYFQRAAALSAACAAELASSGVYRDGEVQRTLAQEYLARFEPNRAVAVWDEHLGLSHAAAGQGDLARAAFARAYAITHDADTYYANLGQLSAGEGHEDEALREYAEGLQFAPDGVKLRLACAYEYARQGESHRAIRHFEDALALAPRYADVHFNLGLLWYDEGDLDRAVECHLAALRINPDYAIARNALAFTLLRRGDYLLARQEYEKTVACGLTSADILVNVARIHLMGGDAQKARQVLETAIQLNPDFVPSHYHLGHAYQMLGMHKKARSARERFLRAAKEEGAEMFAEEERAVG